MSKAPDENNATKGIIKKPNIVINPPVFFGSGIIAIVFVLFAMIWSDTASTVFGGVQTWVTDVAGWFYILSVAIFLIFTLGLAFSAYGNIKLGPDHSTPDYSYGSWFAMLFSAGMGIGLMFFGVAEPVMHYLDPPVGDSGTVEAAREAMKITFFHWGLHAWAIYAVVALALAYFAFRRGLPLTIRSALYPLIGERIYGPIGHAVDIFAVVGTLFGVATSLGLGVMQVNAGLNYLFEVPVSIFVQVLLIIGITIIATGSVVMGLDGGIRRISELNLILAIALLAFVLIAGPTVHLMTTLVQNVGAYTSDIVNMTFNLFAYDQTSWIGGWTLFYWGWWIAWSPFVGMFIARVSRGRSIREFVTGVLLVPMGFTFMWMTFFGNTAINMILSDGITQLGEAVSADSAVALFQFFEYLPFSTIASLLATVLVITFFVTSSDSGSLVVDMLTSGGTEDESPVWQRIFWAAMEGLIAIALLIAGGLAALQTATIASALPFAIIMLLMCWGLIKALRLEVVKQSSMASATLAPMKSADASNWRKRLKAIAEHPKKDKVENFINETVRSAMEAVADELRKQDNTVELGGSEEDGRYWIQTEHGDEMDFFYSVRPKAYNPPSFVMRDIRKDREEKLKYYRAEVHLREGGQDYDIYGWTKEQVIADIIDQYEKHLHFLYVVR